MIRNKFSSIFFSQGHCDRRFLDAFPDALQFGSKQMRESHPTTASTTMQRATLRRCHTFFDDADRQMTYLPLTSRQTKELIGVFHAKK